MCDFDWKEAGLPLRYYGAELGESPVEEEVKKFCLGKETDVLVIQGGNGTSKTKTFCASFTERDRNNKELGLYLSCKYMLCPMFRSARLSNFGIAEYDLYRKYYEIPYLVIDEPGKGDDPNLERAVVKNILSARYDRGNLTGIAMNWTMKEFCEWIGEEGSSRLRETATVLTLDGVDWRSGNRGMPHIGSRGGQGIVKCILCGSPMTDEGTCSNADCACH
jgi:hypothetical protein